jgi:hypothetical protein
VLSTNAREVVKRDVPATVADVVSKTGIQDASASLFDKVKNGFSGLPKKFDKLWEKVKSFGHKAKDTVENKVEDAVEKLKELVNKKD